MPKSRWSGYTGKPKKWINGRESKRLSFKIPGVGDPDICEPEDFQAEAGKGRGSLRTYSPDQIYNYKSRYARYFRALDIQPAQIVEQSNGCTLYRFYSCDSPTKFWTVEVCPEDDATFIEAGPPLQILCPPDGGYQLNQVESDGTLFTWEQITGSRTVIIDPEKELNPKLFIQATCFTNGCDDGSFFPVILQVSVDNTNLSDTLIIYTTPTDTHFGIGRENNIFLPDSAPCREVQQIYYVPVFENKAYCNDGSQPFVITWDLPQCDREFVTGTGVTRNITGSYEVVGLFDIDEERIFEISPNISYRIASFHNRYGRESSLLGTPIQISLNDGLIVFGDEIHKGISVKTLNEFQRVDTAFKRLEEVDFNGGIGSTTITEFGIGIIAVKLTGGNDNHQGIAASTTSRFERIEYGNVTIG